MWHSLLAARDIIREGMRWKVGDGSSIEVSTQKWLSHKPIFLGERTPNLLVKDLLDTTTLQWDWEKIFDSFVHSTRMEILAILLPRSFTRDTLVWKETKSHTFLVKSAYQVVVRMKEQIQVKHSTTQVDRAIWKKIWSLKGTPKVWTFIWRACSNILPTRDNLHRQKLQVEPRCELCCHQHKTVGHLL